MPGVAGSRVEITAVRSLMVLCLGGRSVQSQDDLLLVTLHSEPVQGWSELGAVHNGYTSSRRTSGI